MTPEDHHQVMALMGAYFDGLYHADSAALRKVFHPKLSYVCATQGEELHLDLDSYMARVDRREPPSRRGDMRRDAVLELAFAGPRLARVTARMSMAGRTYLDYLTLTREQTEWRITAKIFTTVPDQE